MTTWSAALARRTTAGPQIAASGSRTAVAPEPMPPQRLARRAVLQFFGSAVLALTLAAAVAGIASTMVAERNAVDSARLVTLVLTRSVIEPNLSDSLLAGDPAAIAQLDNLVIDKITGGRVLRVKLWSPTGRVLYSDDHRIMGKDFPLGPSEREAMRVNSVDAEVSDLDKAENALDRNLGQLLEVYVPVRTPGGHQLLFETYTHYEAVADRAERIFWPIMLVAIGALIVLELVQIPLAWRSARRLGQAQEEREILLRRAIASSQIERRRIASDVHDRIVQELAAASFALAGSATRARTNPQLASEALDAGSGAVRAAIRSARSLLVDIYPPSLHRTGLPAALADLTAPLISRGVDVVLDVPDDLDLPERDAELVYRVAREALSNTVNHSAAAHVTMSLVREDSALVLIVNDDGCGFDADAMHEDRPGHFGLALVRDLALDAGAAVTVRSAAGQGTEIRLELPR